MRRAIATAVFLASLAQGANAYNRTAAYQYIGDWCPSDLNKNGAVDHVNNPDAKVQPGPGNFVWWYKVRPLSFIPWPPIKDKSLTLNDYGSDWVPMSMGFDCTNFVSQVLRGGGITFTGLSAQWDDASHGTFIRVDRLYNALLYSANAVPVTIDGPTSNPSTLAVGDPVRFPKISHMAVIVATNPMVLAYHSQDYCAPTYRPISSLGPLYFPLIGFHIIGDTIAARADVTPPTMELLRADGTTIPDGGFTGTTSVTAILTDGGDGVERLEVFDGAPVIDGMYNFAYGFATERFRDDGIAGGSSTSTISLYNLKDGATAYFQGFDNAGNVTIQGVTMDPVRPSLGLLDANGAPMIPSPSGVSATSMTQVSVRGTDSNAGIGRITILKPDNTTSTQTFSGELIAYATFSALAAGSYTAKVYDRAENYTSGEFLINTGTQGAGEITNARGITQGGIANSTNALSGKCTDNTGAGICSAALSGPSYSKTWSFDAASEAQIGLETSQTLSQGTFTLTCTNCAGSSSQRTVFYSTAVIPDFSMYGQTPQGATFNETQLVSLEEIGDIAATRLRVKVTCLPGGYCNAFDQQTQSQACAMMKLYSGDGQEGQGCYPSPGAALGSELLMMPQSASFVIRNTSLTATDFSLVVEAAIYKFGNYDRMVSTTLSVANGFTLSPGGAMSSSVSVQEVLPYFQATSGQNAIDTTVKTTTLQSWACGLAQSLAPKQLLWLVPNSCIEASGSDLVFLQKTTTTFIVQGSTGPPAIDSSSVRIYGWTGSSWSVSGISRQGAVVSTSSVIVATGAFSRSGLYAILFNVTDGSAPVTSWSIQGSSTGFAGITFVSTYSYLVLSSTDPVVNGFHSGLATTYYRIDGLPGDVFTTYSSSLSFLPGSHWVDYYSTDFAGNSESVKRATITVTAGSVTRLSGDLQVDGNLLVGFLGSGAKAEVVARAEYDYALMVSSVDGRAMLAVDNANFASIGTAPASGRLTLAGVSGDTALALRSGNSTASVTGAQLAFGYDGTSDLRHALYTQHGAADYNNKMVFKLWTPATGSSSTLGNLPVLSLEGSSKTASSALVHIMPAGLGANELVVSNGVGLGLGNVLRWERWQPSAGEFKTGIERLGAKDETVAWNDVLALKPARYRRKVRGPDGILRSDPGAPLERGYIYEEIPESIRAASGGISVDERLVNVELALKAAIREMNALEERLGKLKGERR